jgi:hypothetical protein
MFALWIGVEELSGSNVPLGDVVEVVGVKDGFGDKLGGIVVTVEDGFGEIPEDEGVVNVEAGVGDELGAGVMMPELEVTVTDFQ